MAGSLIPYLMLSSMPLLLALPLTNNTKTDATQSRLWRYDTDMNNKQVMVQDRLYYYAQYCCEKIETDSKNCPGWQLAYWAWIPKDQYTTSQNILNYLNNKFNPETQTDSKMRKMCGMTTVTNDDDFFPYYARAKDNIHTEPLLLKKMRQRAEEQYIQPSTPTNFFLFTTNSPCVTGNTACLGQIFQFTQRSIYQGFNNAQTWTTDMHTLNVGFLSWFTWVGININMMREYFCSATQIPVGTSFIRGIDYYKQVEYGSYSFTGGLSFVKIEDEGGDQEFEDTLGRNKC